jgi:hypothetical protein
MPGPPFLGEPYLRRGQLLPYGGPMSRLFEFFRRWLTWPLAALGLFAWLALLYFMVGDLL